MKNIFIFILTLFFGFSQAQKLDNIQSGEQLTYRIHYGVLTAGSATLSANKKNYEKEPHLHVKGVGRSTGAVRAFFKVEDIYESYSNLTSAVPT